MVVGDDTGVVTCFSVKKGEVTNSFKTLPGPQPVSHVTLGGSGNSKVFVAVAQSIRGISKKGKEFFRFNTNLTEVIRRLVVDDTRLWTAGDYIFQQFVETKDNYFYMVCVRRCGSHPRVDPLGEALFRRQMTRSTTSASKTLVTRARVTLFWHARTGACIRVPVRNG